MIGATAANERALRIAKDAAANTLRRCITEKVDPAVAAYVDEVLELTTEAAVPNYAIAAAAVVLIGFVVSELQPSDGEPPNGVSIRRLAVANAIAELGLEWAQFLAREEASPDMH